MIWSRSSAAFSNSRFLAADFICCSRLLMRRSSSSLGMPAPTSSGLAFGHGAHAVGNILDRLADADWGDAVGLVVRHLRLAAAIGLLDGPAHGVGDGIGVHD